MHNVLHTPRFRRQIFLVVSLCLLLNAAAWLLGEFVLLPGFAKRERVRAERHLQRIDNFLAREGTHLGRLAQSAALNLQNAAVRSGAACPDFAGLGLAADVQKLDALVFLDGAGKVLPGCEAGPLARHLVSSTGTPVLGKGGVGARTGLHGIGSDIWLLAMVSVESPGFPPVAALVLGRRLDAERIAVFSDVLEYSMQLNLAPPPAGGEAPGQEVRLERISPETLLAKALVDDFDGRQRIEISLRLGRESIEYGRLTVRAMQGWVAGLSVLFGALALVTLHLLDRGAERTVVLRELMERSGEALLLVLPDGTISAANPRARQLLGIAPSADGQAAKIDRVLFGVGGERGSAVIASPGDSRRVEIELPLSGGGRAILEVETVEVKLDGRDHLLLQLRDVSLRHEAERLSRLASLGELAAGVAHEINNPAGMIRRNLDFVGDVLGDALPLLAERDDADDLLLGGVNLAAARGELPQLLEDMARGSRRIGEIVRDLKDFVREDSFDGEARFDLNEAAATVIRLLDGTLRKATDHFSAEFEKPMPPTVGNLRQIEQVILNLLQNACQALPDRGRSLRLVTSHHPGTHVNQLQVIDAGEGIPPELLERVVEPFFTTRRETGGTGLGLSVSARIVQNHRGTLQFVSQPGLGTTVTMTLPAAKETP